MSLNTTVLRPPTDVLRKTCGFLTKKFINREIFILKITDDPSSRRELQHAGGEFSK